MSFHSGTLKQLYRLNVVGFTHYQEYSVPSYYMLQFLCVCNLIITFTSLDSQVLCNNAFSLSYYWPAVLPKTALIDWRNNQQRSAYIFALQFRSKIKTTVAGSPHSFAADKTQLFALINLLRFNSKQQQKFVGLVLALRGLFF